MIVAEPADASDRTQVVLSNCRRADSERTSYRRHFERIQNRRVSVSLARPTAVISVRSPTAMTGKRDAYPTVFNRLLLTERVVVERVLAGRVLLAKQVHVHAAQRDDTLGLPSVGKVELTLCRSPQHEESVGDRQFIASQS